MPAETRSKDMILDDRRYHDKCSDAPSLTSSAQACPAGLNRYFAVKLALKERQIEGGKLIAQQLVNVGYWRNTRVRPRGARPTSQGGRTQVLGSPQAQSSPGVRTQVLGLAQAQSSPGVRSQRKSWVRPRPSRRQALECKSWV
eukprot:1142956-Pyramimonas_sp.AAC.1